MTIFFYIYKILCLTYGFFLYIYVSYVNSQLSINKDNLHIQI